ncbi:MAG: PorT family protein [Bacteroidetes bacterium]|nr:PorT family protein [Bacteroidota bacterium]
MNLKALTKLLTLTLAIVFSSITIHAQKNENRIIHISGDDTLVFELGGMKGNLDSLIEETLKSFYNLEGISEIRRFGLSMDSVFTDDFDIKIENESSKEDSVKIKLGNMRIVIIENKDKSAKRDNGGKRKVIIDQEIRMDHEDENHSDHKHARKSHKKIKTPKPKSYWSGLSYGTNGMLNETGSFTNETDASYLKFDYVKSYEVQFNVLEKRFPVYKNHIGVTTGLGFKWNRFTLDNNTIDLNYNDSILYASSSNSEYKRSTLRSAYIQAPLLLEFCSNKNPKKAWHLSVGMVGGLRLGSSWRTKVGNDVTNTKGDFNFRPFAAHAVAILGYDEVSLYVNYGLSNVFEKNTAPMTKMVSAGVIVHF